MTRTHQKTPLYRGLIIGACFLLTQLSMSTYVAAMPQLADWFSKTPNSIKITLTFFLMGYALGQLIWGTLSDRLGRRRTLMTALLLYITCTITVAMSRHFLQFCLAYAALGAMAAAFTSIGNAILKDIYGRENIARAIAYVGIAMACGPSLGPIIGAHLVKWVNWQMVFLFLSGYATLALFAFYACIPETRTILLQSQSQSDDMPPHGTLNKTPQDALKGSTHSTFDETTYDTQIKTPHGTLRQAISYILSNRIYLAYVMMLGSAFGCMTSYLDAASFVYTHYLNVSFVTAGWLLLISGSGYTLGAIVVSQCVHRTGIAPLARIAAGIGCLAGLFAFFVAFTATRHLALILSPFLLLLFAMGMLVPLGKAGAMSSIHDYAGTAASLMKFGQIAITFVMVSIAASLDTSTTLVPLSILLGVGSAISLFFSRCIR